MDERLVGGGRDFRRRVSEYARAGFDQQSTAPSLARLRGGNPFVAAALDDAGRVVLGGIAIAARPDGEAWIFFDIGSRNDRERRRRRDLERVGLRVIVR